MSRFSIVLLLVAVFAVACPSIVPADDAAADKPIRVLLTFGGHGFQQEPFFAMFDAMPGVKYTKAPLPESADMLKPGLEKEFDVIVMYDMVRKIEPAQQEAFIALLNQGIGLVSLHHNMGAHRDWPEFRKIIGGQFVLQPTEIDGKEHSKSTWAHGQDLHIKIADKEHPITKGLSEFDIHDETYGNYYTASDVSVLMTTDNPKNDPEIAWVKKYGNSRVFYLMLGHDNLAWKNPKFPEILGRGIRWAAGK
jgi:type 1 glutamine amidotransferase